MYSVGDAVARSSGLGGGELAALGAAFCWALSSVLFRRAGQKVTPTLLNLYKGLIAIVVFAAILLIWPGTRLWEAEFKTLLILLASGVIGIGVGDTAFFKALNQLGERKTVLIAETLAPPITAGLAFVWLAESLSAMALAGIAITVAGVAWVVVERAAPATATAPGTGTGGESAGFDGVSLPIAESGKSHGQRRHTSRVDSRSHLRPVLLSCVWALVAAGCQAVGAIMSRQALTETEIGPFASSLLRLVGGVVVLFIWMLSRQQSLFPKAVRRVEVWRTILLATLIGTVLGILLQQTSLQFTRAAVSQTLVATSVLFVLPLMMLRGERVGWRAWFGAAAAVVGVGLLVMA